MYQENTAQPAPATTAPNAPLPGHQASGSDDHRLVIESRFGALAISPENAVAFPNGLLGFPELRNFALADLDDARFPQLKVLQSLDDEKMSFLTLPLDPENGVIDKADLTKACENLKMSFSDLVVLLVVSVRRMNNDVVVSANLRAPLLIDTVNNFATQYVLSNDRYPVRLPL